MRDTALVGVEERANDVGERGGSQGLADVALTSQRRNLRVRRKFVDLLRGWVDRSVGEFAANDKCGDAFDR